MIRRRILNFLIFHFYLIVNFTTAYPKIFLVQDPDESRNHYGNILHNISHRNSRHYDDIELITKALEIVKQEKSGLTAVEINKCLYTNFGNTKQKFNCIKKLIYKGKSGNVDSKPYVYTKYYNKRLPDYEHNFDDKFLDLTKSGYDNDGKRSFQNILKFSQDYLDIHDLLRTETAVDFTDDEPTKIESKDDFPMLIQLKNNHNLLRDFSRDYLDTQNLFRRDAKVLHEIPNEMINTGENKDSHGLNLIKLYQKPKENKSKKNLYVFKLLPIKNEIKDARRLIGPQDDFIKKRILRTLSDESDTSDESDESQSKEKEKVKRKKTKRKDKKLKRFQVVDKSAEHTSDEENTSNESDIPMQRPIEIPKKEKKVFYMQAPNRIFKIRNDSRRRLPHFLPKRYHWDEEDMRNLDSYWFNGPQGKYWGHYKTPY